MSEFSAHADEVAAAFGVGAVVAPMCEVASGEQARIWRLDTSVGSFAVKQPRRGFQPSLDGVDVAFQEAVLAQVDVRMPTPVRRPGGAFVTRVGGELVRVSTWVDLLPPRTGLDPRRVGELLAALHQVDFTVPHLSEAGVDPWYWAPVGKETWQALADRLAAAGAPFAGTFRDAQAGLVKLESLLEPPAEARICHRDLWADNLVRTTSGDLCVIDWDNSGLADPSHELGTVVFEFGQADAKRIRALYDSYVGAGGPGGLTRPGQLTMLIAQFGHFWETAAKSWLDPGATDADRTHAQERINELMNPPLTVAAINAILDALG